MANEAVIIELLGNGGDPISMGCADGAGIAKGTICVLQDDRIVAAGDGTPGFGGIAAMEKVSGDGSERISVYTFGIFDLHFAEDDETAAGGRLVVQSAANTVGSVGAGDSLTAFAGITLETGTSLGTHAVLVGSGL